LRINIIKGIEAANTYLENKFLLKFNGRFTVKPNRKLNAHRSAGNQRNSGSRIS
jgi:ABC-type Zn2+ transport system substrate-binding protein/surface adhesin